MAVVAAGVAPPFAGATAATVPATAAGFTADVVTGFAAVPLAGFAAGVVFPAVVAVVAVVAGRVPGLVFVDEPAAITPGMVFVVAVLRFVASAAWLVATVGAGFTAGLVATVAAGLVAAFVVTVGAGRVMAVAGAFVVEVAAFVATVVAGVGFVVVVVAVVFGAVATGVVAFVLGAGATAIAPDSSVVAVVFVELEPPAFVARNDQPGFAAAAAANACFDGVTAEVVAGFTFVVVVAGVPGAPFAPPFVGGTREAFGPEPAMGFAAVVRSMRSAPVGGTARAPVVFGRGVVETVPGAGVLVDVAVRVVVVAFVPVAVVAGFVARFPSTVVP